MTSFGKFFNSKHILKTTGGIMYSFMMKVKRVTTLLVLIGFTFWRGMEFSDFHHFKADFKISDLLRESAKHEGGDNTSDKGKVKFHKDIPLRKEEEDEKDQG